MNELKPYLEKQLDIYKKMLIKKVEHHNFNLQHPEVIAYSQSIDILVVRYWTVLSPKPDIAASVKQGAGFFNS